MNDALMLWKSSIKYFFSKCDQIRSFLQIRSHLPKKSLIDITLFFCAVLCHAHAMHITCMDDYILKVNAMIFEVILMASNYM